MNKLQIATMSLLVVILLGGLAVIVTEPAQANVPACCHCLCDCNHPDENKICYVPIYDMQNCAACGTIQTDCGSGPGGFCQW